MSKWLRIIKSSFADQCCDDTGTVEPGAPVYAWRGLSSSVSCVLDGGGNKTGYAHVGVLEKYDTATNLATGDTKLNVSSDTDYIADYIDLTNCAVVPPTGGVADFTYKNDTVEHLTITLNYDDGVHHTNLSVNGVHDDITVSVPDGVFALKIRGFTDWANAHYVILVDDVPHLVTGITFDLAGLSAPVHVQITF